jgi:lipopolysaccharide export system permease protein
MKKIERYIFVHLFKSTLLVLVALVALLTFMQLSREVTQVGQGEYTLKTLFLYTFLTLPSYAYEMFPFAVLIGVLIAMSQFVQTSEYAVMRTLGMSVGQVSKILLLFGGFCALLVSLLGEFIAPEARQNADRIRMIAKNDSIVSYGTFLGIWAKDRQQYIRIGEMLPDGALLNLQIYHYSPDYRLISNIYAQEARYNEKLKQWHLYHVLESDISSRRIQVVQRPEGVWHTVLRPDLLSALVTAPEQMSSVALLRYIEHLAKNKQKTQRYELALWSKWLYPLSCMVMAWFALIFIPHLRRSGLLAKRIILGIIFGLLYYFLNRFVLHLGLLYHWIAPLCVLLPITLFASFGVLGIWRQERR